MKSFLTLFGFFCFLPLMVFASSGTFTLVTYNVAGLLEQVSSAETPRVAATREISKYVNDFDIVHVQEDFNYHKELYNGGANHQFRSRTTGPMGFGSGLNTLSRFPFHPTQNSRWADCIDFDCLTPKGFTFTEIEVAEDVFIHFYNLHAQAGGYEMALIKFKENYEQLSRFVKRNSNGFPVLIAGDFNLRYPLPTDFEAAKLLLDLGFKDVWIENVRKPAGLGFPEFGPRLLCDLKDLNQTKPECESIDKIYFRSNDYVTLTPVDFEIKTDTLTPENLLLSDHVPTFVEMQFQTNVSFFMTKAIGGFKGGFPFNDFDQISSTANLVSKISLSGGKRLLSVKLTYADGTAVKHGGVNAFNKELKLAANERLLSAEICKDLAGWRKQTERVFFLSITTSLGKTISAGKRSGSCESVEEVAGMEIVGFHGREGAEIDKLGFIYRVIV